MNGLKLSMVALLAMGLASCGSGTKTPGAAATLQPQRIICPSDSTDPCSAPPSDPAPTPTSGVVLSSDTRILGDELQRYNPDDGSLTLYTDGTTQGYAVGNILIGGISGASPVGVPPSRITGITPSGNVLIISTTPASLPDAVEQGSVNFTRTLTSADVAEDSLTELGMKALNGQSLLSALSVDCNTGSTFTKSFNKSIPFGSGSEFNSCLGLGIDTTLNLSISGHKLNTFEASVKLSETAKMELKLMSQSVHYQHDWEIGRIKFNPIPVALGPIPIVFTPYVIFSVGVDGQVSANISYGVSQTATYTAGIKYANGTLSKIGLFSPTLVIPPLINSGSITASAKAYLDVKPGVNFWSTVILATADGDVNGTVRGYGKADVDTNRQPTWKVSAGVQFCYGYKVKLDVIFGIYSKTWSGDGCGGEIPLWERQDGGTAGGPVSTGTSFNSVILNFTNVYGGVEVYKTDPRTGAQSRIGTLSGNGNIDITGYLDPSLDTPISVTAVAKSPSWYQSYRWTIDMAVTANGAVAFDPPGQSCTGCHSQTVYNLSVNKNLGTIK